MYTYLLLDLFSISIPLLYSFERKVRFASHWRSLLPAIVIPAAFFIIWDIWFTEMGVWGFNPRYLTGIFIFHLPIEEWLFFICIPYACVFTYEALRYYIKKDFLEKSWKIISLVIILISAFIGVINIDKWYSSTTFLLLGSYLAYLVFIKKASYLSRFFIAYLVIIIPFFIVNGILTGSFIEDQVVWYNDLENLGIRMGTIPVEDTFYGMLLILMNVSLYEYFKKRVKEQR